MEMAFMSCANVLNAWDICPSTVLTQLSLPWQAATFESKVDSVVLSVANVPSTDRAALARATVLLPEARASPAISAV